MTPTPYGPYPRQTKPPTIGGSLALLGIFFGFLLFLSYPLIMTALVAGVTVTALGIRRHLKKLKESNNEPRSLSIPGIGNIELRIKPNKH